MKDRAKAYLAKLRSLVRNLSRREHVDADLDEELRSYTELVADEHRDRGMAAGKALRTARIELGGLEQVKEGVRDIRAGATLHALLRDIRHGGRVLRKSPGFTLVTLVTLALCIGANTAIFSVVHSLLLRPLPYSDPEQLVYISEYWPHEPPFRVVVSPDYGNWRAIGKTFEAIEAYNRSGIFHLTGDGDAERLHGAGVTAGFLDLVGVRPAYGRSFLEEECQPGAPPVVMLSHNLWRRRFNSSPKAISKTIVLNGRSYLVVGVLPASFLFPDNEFSPDLLTPLTLPPRPNWHDESNFRVLRVLARLKREAGPDVVGAELTSIARSTASIEPLQFKNMRRDLEVRVTPLRERLAGDVRQMIWLLQAAVGMVLLIGCLNIANLQLARAVSRENEFAVRAALGASRTRIAWQLVTENLLLAGLGGLGGLVVGYYSLPLLRPFMPADIRLLDTVGIDMPVLGITFAVALLAAIATGLAPLRGTLKAGFRTYKSSSRTTSSAGQQRLRSALVVAQISFAMVLMSASGLLIRAFIKLANIDPGFEPRGVLTLRVSLRGDKYETPQSRTEFATTLIHLAKAVPGVQSAAVAEGAPVLGTRSAVGTRFEGRSAQPPGIAPVVPYLPVSSSYFESLGIRMVRGRGFSAADHENSVKVAIINEAFADEFFPFEDPIGKRIKTGASTGPWREIVGVTRDVAHRIPSEPNRPQICVPLTQNPIADLVLLLKSSVPPASLAEEAKTLLRAIDRNQPVHDIATMEQRLSDALSTPRSNTILMSLLGSVALALAVAGLLGVLSYVVSQRSHEIAIRMALGARKQDIARVILRWGLALTGAGVAIGLTAAPALTRALDKLLPGIGTGDLSTLVTVALWFIVVATAACFVPASRAARVDPMTNLRHD